MEIAYDEEEGIWSIWVCGCQILVHLDRRPALVHARFVHAVEWNQYPVRESAPDPFDFWLFERLFRRQSASVNDVQHRFVDCFTFS